MGSVPDEGESGLRQSIARRSFLGSAIGFTLIARGSRGAVARNAPTYGPEPPGFPRQDLELVEKTVRFAHFDLDATRELVRERPALARSSWDWGFGDWETPIGAASHTGGREMVGYLLSHRARPTLFTLAMLGKVDAVRATIEALPGVQRITGPHGLTLLQHARAGGAAAAEVAAYLEELGDADPRPTDIPLTAEQRRAYLGSYKLNTAYAVSFRIVERKEHVAFGFAEDPPRNLLYQGDHQFQPAGVEAVRFRFEFGPVGVEGVSIRAGGSTLLATRQGS